MLCSVHLVELEELFDEILFLSHKDSTNLHEAALRVCPDIMLHHSDEYMASLINHLSLEGKENIFVICGYGQSRTIPYHLYHNPRAFKTDCLDSVTRFSDPYETLIRKDTPEIMTDKLCIIDQLYNENVQ